MTNKKQEIEDIFSIFHDGGIESYSIISDAIHLKIGIQYLAHIINSEHKFINLSLLNVESLKFDAWSDEPLILTNWNEILDLDIEIHSAEIDSSEQIIVHTRCNNSTDNLFQGGKLIINCSDYKLTDEAEKNLTIDKLKDISRHYWNEIFGKK
jgi:hypothetical protein